MISARSPVLERRWFPHCISPSCRGALGRRQVQRSESTLGAVNTPTAVVEGTMEERARPPLGRQDASVQSKVLLPVLQWGCPMIGRSPARSCGKLRRCRTSQHLNATCCESPLELRVARWPLIVLEAHHKLVLSVVSGFPARRHLGPLQHWNALLGFQASGWDTCWTCSRNRAWSAFGSAAFPHNVRYSNAKRGSGRVREI